MYATIRILNGFQEPLTYKIPKELQSEKLIGSIVAVPLRNRRELGCIVNLFAELSPLIKYEIKEIFEIEKFPHDINYQDYTKKLAYLYDLDPIYFLKRTRAFIDEKEFEETPNELLASDDSKKIELTNFQENIVKQINPQIENPTYFPALIHGVTGSGKTEIYKQLIIKAINTKKTVLLLLPEVSLAVQFQNLLIKDLKDITILGFHSATGPKEKKNLWQKLIKKESILIIGVHLPILLPIANLGLIIIDEEHETGFQEKKHPRINTKDAAIIRAQLYNIPIILGSATPSIQSLYNITNKNWRLFELQNRFSGKFPEIKLIKLTENIKRKNFWISQELEKAIKKNLEKNEQVIIFLNRRGYSFFVQCKLCGFIPMCQNCSVSLTLHDNKKLVCHYCNYSIIEPEVCIECKSAESSLIKKGIGTQQIVKILQNIFPNTIIERADLDTTINKKRWQETMKKFTEGTIQILVGTQTITKGYHFPKVTLVGILWADINLGIPFYNASEVTLAQLIQVAGRAGRQSNESLVIVQTMINHPIYNYLSEINYKQFYDYEIKNREKASYPPIIKLAEIEIRSNKIDIIEKESSDIANFINKYSLKFNRNITVLGPAEPPVQKIKNIFIRKIYLKSKSFNDLINAYNLIDKSKYSSFIFFTPNPQSS